MEISCMQTHLAIFSREKWLYEGIKSIAEDAGAF